jgi:nitrite reductase (NADH) small subunit
VSERGWVPVGRAADVPELEGRSVQFGARRVAIFRLPAGWAAVDHACPHQGGPLADGPLDGTLVTCPWHGWQFDVRTGKTPLNGKLRQATYEVKVEGRDVLVAAV